MRNEVIDKVEIEINMEVIFQEKKQQANKLSRLENIVIKDRLIYSDIHQLFFEAREKFTKINPETIGQASRIPGISPE